MRNIHGEWRTDPRAVTLVDAHHHLWDLGSNYYPWLSDHPEPFFLGNYDALKQDYLPEDYRRDAAAHNVLATVHVEAEWDRADQVGETRWLSAVAEREGFPNATVAHAWFHTEDAAEIIAQQASFPLVRGIRSKPVVSTTPGEMVRGSGTMHDDNWLRGFSLLERFGLSWDLRVPFWHLPEAGDVAEAFPRTPIVLNHTGFPWDRSDEGLQAWRKAMEAIARAPSVHLKISEFGLKDEPWDMESNRRIVLDAISIFGIERCMFGTNFPVAGLRIGYDALVRSVAQMVAHLPEAEQDRFFWKNAIAFYRL